MQKDEEQRIIEKVKKGDTEAFEELVKAYERQVYNVAFRILSNVQDAQDAAQEAFVKAYINLSSFRGDSKFSVWLYRLTNNCCIDMIRRRKETISLSMDSDDGKNTTLDIPDDNQNPEQRVIGREAMQMLVKGIEGLPEDYRSCIVLREIGGQSYAEIAEILSIDIGTVKSRIFRARKKLFELMKDGGNFSYDNPSDITEGRCAE